MDKLFCRAIYFAVLVGTCSAAVIHAQQPSPPAPKRTAIRAGRLIDGKTDAPISNALILIEGDKIVSVTPLMRSVTTESPPLSALA
jgi:hypothetical protein